MVVELGDEDRIVGIGPGNIKSLLRRERGYKNLRYLLLKVQRMAATKSKIAVLAKAA